MLITPAPHRDLGTMTEGEARMRVAAELRWTFCKALIEPYIKEASKDPDAIGLLPNHEFLIRCSTKAQLIVKSRKTAHSWATALNALARAATEPYSTTIIGSYDEEEAKDKNNFIEWQYSVLPKSVRDELKLSDGSELRKCANGSRIRFIARKAPTGAGAAIQLDEFSVERKGGATAEEMLIASFGATTHSGFVRLGGTERDPNTVFHQIRVGKFGDRFKGTPFEGMFNQIWEKGEFAWWDSPALCVDPLQAAIQAPTMETADRVEKFGNEKLKIQYMLYLSNPESGLEVFQREFEMTTLDDNESYYTITLINDCYSLDENYWFEHDQIEGARYGNGQYGDCLADAKVKIDALAREIRNGRMPGEFGMAMDIGRHHDQDEFWVGHNLPMDREYLCPRLCISMSNMPFPGKQELIAYAMANLPIRRGYIDGTRGGLGVQLAEWAHYKYNEKAMIFEFTNNTKLKIATGLKGKMQNQKIIIPNQKKFSKLKNQMLKLKKLTTTGGGVIFDIERNKNQHGDCYWGFAMLCDLFTIERAWVPRGSHTATQTPAPSIYVSGR